MSERNSEKKKSGRFRVTIDTIADKNSLYLSYAIKIEDFIESDYIRIYNEHYTGSNPEKWVSEKIEKIKSQERSIKETKVYYRD